MILRISDWGRYPGAIVHSATSNESFLEFTEILRQIGVAHYFIVLALHDPTLEHVDPHDPNIDPVTAGKVMAECMVNPWYFFRECVRVPADGMAKGSRFTLNRGIFAMYWAFFNNIDAAVEFLRQHGKTIGMATLELYLLRFLENTRTIHVTKGPVLRSETIETLKKLRDGLPEYLFPHHPDDPDNKEAFACTAQGNRLITAIGQNDEMSANGVGRGLTAGRLFDDEGPFTKNIHHILPAAFGSGGAARRINEAEGVPYGNVIATTPGDLDTPEGAYIHGLMTAGINWDERFLDVPTRSELIKIITRGATAAEPRIIFYIKFNHLQLGTTDDELYRMVSNASGTPEQKRKDYGGEWGSGGLGKPYSPEDADRMKSGRMKPAHLEILTSGYILNWYYPEQDVDIKLRTVHVIGLDTSEAVGRDAIGFVLTNSETGEVGATMKVKESNIIAFSMWLAEFMLKYENTVMIIERKSTGSSVVDSLLLLLQKKVLNLHRRLYVKITQEYSTDSELYKAFRRGPGGQPARFWDTFRKYVGFSTDKTKRAKLYGEVFSNSLKLAAHLMRSEALIDEVLALVERNGRIDHVKSEHDDTVIAWMLTMWFLMFGKNLSHYGISNQRLMIRGNSGLLSTEEEDVLVEKENEQRALIAELEEKQSLLRDTTCVISKMRLRNTIALLMSRIDTDTSGAASINELKELLDREKMRSS